MWRVIRNLLVTSNLYFKGTHTEALRVMGYAQCLTPRTSRRGAKARRVIRNLLVTSNLYFKGTHAEALRVVRYLLVTRNLYF